MCAKRKRLQRHSRPYALLQISNWSSTRLFNAACEIPFFMSPVPQILHLDPHKLTEHPLLAALPVFDERAPEFVALQASIADAGVDVPILVDERDRILDGRNRARACRALGRAVPALRRRSEEASEIALRSLINRRHLPKGALAYLAVPLFAEAVEAGRARRLANLKEGVSRNPIQSGIGKTVEQLAADLGFSPDLHEQAVKVRKLFESPKKREWHDGRQVVQMTLREWFEPRLLSGEIGLGGILQAVAGKDSTEGQPAAKRALPVLIRRGFSDLSTRFARWETLPPAERRTLARDVAKEATEWPEDVRNEVLAQLEQVAKARPAKPQF